MESFIKECLTQAWKITLGLTTALAAAHAAAWEPNEAQVSAEQELVDLEFSQTRAQFTWVDATGRLWLGNVDRDSGLFNPIDGRAILVDPDALTISDAKITFDGPEWVRAAAGDQIAYTKFPAGKAHNARNARIAVAKQGSDGSWSYWFLSPDASRLAPYGSEDAEDRAPRITYVDSTGNHYWRETGKRNSEQLIPAASPSNTPIRHVRGARAVLLSKEVDGVQQVHYYDLDAKTLQQLTFDPGTKTGSWMWKAPEFGDEFVLATLVIEGRKHELRVYRQVHAPDGAVVWTPIFSANPPLGGKIYSPEPFTWQGRSYLFMAISVAPNKFSSEIWIMNIDAARPMFRRISADTPLRARVDPEVFITNQGPRIYFGRFLLTDDPTPSPCVAITCSEGVWISDPGLVAAP